MKSFDLSKISENLNMVDGTFLDFYPSVPMYCGLIVDFKISKYARISNINIEFKN